jgi:hypothetical protein
MSLLTKIGLFLLVLLVIFGALWLACHFAYQSGQTAGTASEKALWDKSVAAIAAADKTKAAQTQAQITPIEAQAATQVAAAASAPAPEIKIIRQVIHDTPTYAACARPAAVEQLRNNDLSDLAKLAAQSASAAPAGSSSVSGSGSQ